MRVMVRRALLSCSIAAMGTVAGLWWWRKQTPPGAGPAGGPRDGEFGTLRRIVPQHPAPSVTLMDAQGRPASLAAWRGRGLVLNFWATWCVPCVREMPSLQALARASPQLAVVPASSDAGGAEAVRQFYAAHAITALPVWLDPHGAAGEAMGIAGLPSTFLIGPDGTLRGLVEGGADWMALRPHVEALLA